MFAHHNIQSVLAIFVLWLCPSLRPKMPARQTLLPCVSIHSLKSTTSTLVDYSSDEEESNDADKDEPCEYIHPVHFRAVANYFHQWLIPPLNSTTPSLNFQPPWPCPPTCLSCRLLAACHSPQDGSQSRSLPSSPVLSKPLSKPPSRPLSKPLRRPTLSEIPTSAHMTLSRLA